MLPESASFPSNDEIEEALAGYHALFAADTHPAALRAQRAAALSWMRRLAAWDPVLVGGVAAGWATTHSDIRLELVADDPKTIEIALVGQAIPYTAVPPRGNGADPAHAVELRIDDPPLALRLTILSHLKRRNRPRHEDDARLDAASLEQLLQSEG